LVRVNVFVGRRFSAGVMIFLFLASRFVYKIAKRVGIISGEQRWVISRERRSLEGRVAPLYGFEGGGARLAAMGAILGGDLGGPIRKDRLWYYMSLRRQDNTVSVTGFPVENPGTFGQLTSLQNGTYKLSYQLSQNNKISHYIQYGRKLMPERGASSTGYRWTVFQQDSGSWAANIEWSSIVSPKFFFRVAGSSFGYNWPNLPYGPNGELNENLDYRMTDNGSARRLRGVELGGSQRRRRWR
jgi:hypothetical protein